MTDINLDQMRQDIDNIDGKLTDLFKERMEKSLEIAKYKKDHKVPVFSDKREKEILHKVSEQIGEPFDGYARLLFNTIFDASRSCQNNYMAKRSDLADRIEEALKETPNLFPKKAVVACQGVAGSYSQAACEKLFEVPSIMYQVFTGLGLYDFTIRLNNRKVLNGLFEMYGLSEIAMDVMRVIDKLEKIGEESVKAELSEMNVPAEASDGLLALLTFKGSNSEILEKLKGFAGRSEKLDLGVQELSEVVYYMDKFGVPQENYRVDLTIARGLDYYTGTVYETTFNRHPELGSICSGGRYDNLAEFYTKKKLPGVGMSIGLTRLFYILNEFDYLNRVLATSADVLVIPMTEDMAAAVEISAKLRAQGISTQIYFEKKKFKHKISYADKLSIPYAMFLGEDELKENKVTLKKMFAAEDDENKQCTVSLEEAESVILDGLKALRQGACIQVN